MSSRRLFGLLRVLFLALTLACLATRIVWVEAPHWVDRVDGWIVGTAHHGVRTLLAEGKAALEEGDQDRGLELLLEFADRTQGVRKGDRTSPNRISGLLLLTREYRRRGEPAEALRYSEALHEHDPRYVPNELVRAELLAEVGRHEESLAILERMKTLGAGSAAVSTGLLHSYCFTGRPEEALRLLESLGESGPLALPLEGWELRLRPAGGVVARATPHDLGPMGGPADRAAGYGFRFEAGADAPLSQDFRIDAPRGSRFELIDPRVVVERVEGGTIELGADAIVTSPRIEHVDDRWIGDGASDAYLVFRAAEDQAIRAVEFRATLKMRADPLLVDLLGTPEGVAARSRLEPELSPWLRDRLEALDD